MRAGQSEVTTVEQEAPTRSLGIIMEEIAPCLVLV